MAADAERFLAYLKEHLESARSRSSFWSALTVSALLARKAAKVAHSKLQTNFPFHNTRPLYCNPVTNK